MGNYKLSYTGEEVDNLLAKANNSLQATESVMGFWKGTKAEYNALETKDPSIIYIIMEE
jgi:hypothetical protein